MSDPGQVTLLIGGLLFVDRSSQAGSTLGVLGMFCCVCFFSLVNDQPYLTSSTRSCISRLAGSAASFGRIISPFLTGLFTKLRGKHRRLDGFLGLLLWPSALSYGGMCVRRWLCGHVNFHTLLRAFSPRLFWVCARQFTGRSFLLTHACHFK